VSKDKKNSSIEEICDEADQCYKDKKFTEAIAKYDMCL